MLAFFRIVLEHPRVCLRMHARAPSRDRLSRVSAPLLRRVIIPSLLHLSCCCVTCDRESTWFSSRCISIVFFPVAHVLHTSPVNRRRDVSAFSRPNAGRARTRTRTHPVNFHTISPFFFFFTHLSGRDFVGPPHILDSAVLISELWAHRGNSHSKNGFFRPSGAVMER